MIKCIIAGRRSGKTFAAAEWVKAASNGIIITPYEAVARSARRAYDVEIITCAQSNLMRGRMFDRIVFDEPFFMPNPYGFYVDNCRGSIRGPLEESVVFVGTPTSAEPQWINNGIFAKYRKHEGNTWDELFNDEEWTGTPTRRWSFEF